MSLTSYLIEGLLPEEEKKQTTAVYAGGFKPPTSGHFEVVQQALKKNPEIDEFIIFVGAKERNGISQTESLLIWEIYNNYLPFKVKIEPTSIPPIKAVYDFAKNHPTREVLWVIGAREGNEEDFKDITSRTKSISKYPNLELRTIVTSGGVSGTAARNAAKVSLDKFAKFVPDQLSDEETEEVFDIVSQNIQEELKQLNKNSLSNFDIDKLPKGKIFDDAKNIESIFKKSKHSWDKVVELFEKNKDFSKVVSIPIFDIHITQPNIQSNKVKHIISNLDKIPNINVVEFPDGEKVIYDGHHRLIANWVLGNKEIKSNLVKLKQLNENASYSQNIDLKREIAKLTKHMLDKGMNIQPLPKLVFKNGDSENAKQFLGKTAYYDPNSMSIVLYTEGRHPKDIVRSFSHEMVHHTQNLEGRLGDVSTTNTQEDDNLDKLEQEANLKGTMTFRNWTDSLNESKQEPTDSMVLIISDKGNGLNLYDTITKQILGYINVYNNNVTGVAAKKGYGPLMYELGMAYVYPNGLQSDRNGNTEPEAESVLNKFIAGTSPNIKVVKLTPNDKDYKTEYPNGNELWDVNNFFNYKFFNPNKSTLEKLISNGNKLSPEEQENIRKSGYNFYDGVVNEAVVGNKIECDNCDWSWNIVDGGNDLFICHKCGHDNTPINEKKTKDPFGLNAYAMELGRLREEEIDVSGLDKLDDEIKKALEDASKEEAPTNEIIGLTTVALIVAIPGIINAITKVIKALAQKSGIQLKKEDPKWYEVLEKATDKIDGYLDTPFNFMLKPFVKDSIKRAKYAKILKAVTLTLMSISALADPSKIKDTTSLIKSLAPDIGGELIQAIGEKNSSNIGKMLKVAFNNIK